ncbi:MAG TPA: tripartite tricarboxylate transporter substrate binding protein [Burkholderiales bacterium]
MRRLTSAVFAVACAFALPASAQNYPTKPVRLIVPFAAGGGTDIIGRIVAQQMSEALGQQFVVDNRGGAGSVLGSDIASKSPPDGYTLLLGNISLAFNASLYRKLPFDAVHDFAPVTLVAVQPNILVIHPGLPAKSLREFVALAHAQPGKLNFASAGTGSGTHLAMELLKLKLKMDVVHVPYKGTGPALTDLIGGQVSSMLSTFASALPYVKAGRLRPLGVTGKTRSQAAPDVPTLVEAGVPDYEYTTWYGLLAPRGTPRPVVDKLAKTAATVLRSEDAKHKFATQGVDPLVNTPAEFAAYLKSETEKWGAVIRAAHIPQQ